MKKPDKMFLVVIDGEQVWGDEFPHREVLCYKDRILDALRTEEINATVYEVTKEDA